MKKLLFGFFLLLNIDSFAVPGVFYIYSNCNGYRQFIEEIREEIVIVNGTAVLGNYFPKTCPTLCQGCKLEVYFGYESGNGYYEDIIKNFPINFGSYLWDTDNSGIKKLNPQNDRYYIEFDLESFNPSNANQSIGINGFWLTWQCMTLVPTNSKDNIQFDNMQICKGDCVTIGSFISPNDNVDITSFGCGPTPLVPSGGMGWTTLHMNQECFSEVGSFPICITVTDICGPKLLKGVVEVVDCVSNSAVNCQLCCNFMLNNNVHITDGGNNTGIYYLSMPIGEHTTCGSGVFEVTFTDGSKVNVTGNTVGPFAKKIAKICFKIPGCPECQPACLNVE